MKKYIYRLFSVLLTAAVMTACVEEEGTEPGSNPAPAVTIYQYTVEKPLNPENDVRLRFVVNNKTTDAYYLAEKTTDKNTRISSLSEEGYKDYVISNGVKLSGIPAESAADVTLTDLAGEYTITAVAVSGGTKTSTAAVFTGIEWETLATGTYEFFNSGISGISSSHTALQICTTDDKLYRFKDVFGEKWHMKINLLDLTGEDADGKYRYFRVPVTETPYTYGDYGAVSVRDIGYWQGSDVWVTDNGYESGMYEDYSCFVYVQYFVTAGNLGYNYDFFIPD
jgi:hypothetical protein